MRGRRQRAVTGTAVGAFVMMVPLMAAAVEACFPDPVDALFSAANLAAQVATDLEPDPSAIFINEEALQLHSMTDSHTENAPQNSMDIPYSAEKLSEDKPFVFSFDDSEMLSWGDLEVPNSSNEERFMPDGHEVGDRPYPTDIDDEDGVISAVSYGFFTGDSFVNLEHGQVRNLTHVSNADLLEASRSDYAFTVETDGTPQVLIMHTHATESYEPYERDFYDEDFNSRTTDPAMNMISVGHAITAELEEAGIGVIHDETLHDYPSYNGSYDLSRETVKRYLEEYPSIKVVLDVHRDAIERDSGERIAPIAEIDGKNAAQVMIISGCDDGDMGMPDYMENFKFAAALQNQLESDWEDLTRPVLFDYRKYNQDLTTGSILIEVGGHANSIEQAQYSGELIGKSLVNLFT